jgi:hypothetical protein
MYGKLPSRAKTSGGRITGIASKTNAGKPTARQGSTTSQLHARAMGKKKKKKKKSKLRRFEIISV